MFPYAVFGPTPLAFGPNATDWPCACRS